MLLKLKKNIKITIAISIMNKEVSRKNSIFHVWYVCLRATPRLNFSSIDIVTKQVHCCTIYSITSKSRKEHPARNIWIFTYHSFPAIVAFICTLYIFLYPVTSSSGKNTALNHRTAKLMKRISKCDPGEKRGTTSSESISPATR